MSIVSVALWVQVSSSAKDESGMMGGYMCVYDFKYQAFAVFRGVSHHVCRNRVFARLTLQYLLSQSRSFPQQTTLDRAG